MEYRPRPLDPRAGLASPDEIVESVPSPEDRSRARLDASRVAKTAVSKTLRLSLTQAQAIAILRHPRLAALRERRGIAKAAEIAADLRPDPELSLVGFWTLPEAVLSGVASLRWDLLPSGTQDARRGLAGALKQQIDAEIAQEEWRVAQDARQAWLELQEGKQRFEISAMGIELARETRDFSRRMVDAGAIHGGQVALAEFDLVEAERERTAAEGNIATLRAKLSEAVGLPPPYLADVVANEVSLGPMEPRIPEGDADTAILERLPNLRAALAAYDVAEKELEIACLGSKAKFSIGPDLQRDATSTYVGGGGTVTLPIFNANRAAIAEATTRRDIARGHFDELLYSARTELAIARNDEVAKARTLLRHESEVVPRAKEVQESAERALAAGVADLLFVLQARERALRAAKETIALRAEHAMAVARLEAAFGPEPPPPPDPASRPRSEP